MPQVKESFRKLIIDEEDTVKDLERLVDSAAKVFKIEQPSGMVVFSKFGELTDRQRICIVLIGKYFAVKMGIVQNHAMGISEIANELGRPVTSLSGPLRELVRKGFVQSLPERKYAIAHHRISEFLESLDNGEGK